MVEGQTPASGSDSCGGIADIDRLVVLEEAGLDAQPDPSMEWFAERVRRWVRVPVSLVSLVRLDEQVFPGAVGLGEPFASSRRTPLTHSFCQHVVATGRQLIVQDARTDPMLTSNLAIADLGVVAYAGMPLTDEAGYVLGSLCAIDHVPRPWAATEVETLRDLALACSTELRLRLARRDAQRERARRDHLELSLRESVDRSQTLLEVSRSVGDSTTVEQVRAGLVDLAGGVLGADHVALFATHDDDLHLLEAPGAQRSGSDRAWAELGGDAQAPPRRAVAEQRIVSCSTGEECEVLFPTTARALGLQAMAAAPVSDTRGVLGVLMLGWRGPRVFSPPDLLLVSTVAAYTARAFDHVGWVQHRVSVAREMQQAMLTTVPDVPGLRMAARYVPADDQEYVGGDWYDVLAFPDDWTGGSAVAVSVGDIVGHALDAAIDMGQVRSMLRQSAWNSANVRPSSILHGFEIANAGTGLEAAGTAVMACLRRGADPGRWVVSWVNAGHPHPILVHADGTTRLLDGHGRLFGLPRGSVEDRHDLEITVPAGATLILYTDGVVERRGVDVDKRTHQLCTLLSTCAGMDPDAMADAVLRDFGQDAGDDIVVLAARFE